MASHLKDSYILINISLFIRMLFIVVFSKVLCIYFFGGKKNIDFNPCVNAFSWQGTQSEYEKPFIPNSDILFMMSSFILASICLL